MELGCIFYRFCLFLLTVFLSESGAQKLEPKEREDDGRNGVDRLKIEGFVEKPDSLGKSDKYWYANTRIYTETGQTAFIQENGSFVLHNLYWGIHFIYISSPVASYAPVRVDLLPKGKMRVRKLNVLQPAKLDVISGPLRFKSLGTTRYFQTREQWQITDLLFNPMVLMTVVPLGLLLLMPKFSDPEMRKEMEAQLPLPKTESPDLAEFFTNLLGGGGSSSSSDARKLPRSGGPNAQTGPQRAGRRRDK